MHLALENVSRKHGAEDHIHPLSMQLAPGAINVLLGTTRAGKTSLMRLMAGLDQPSAGRVLADGHDVTGLPVRKRDLAMVYQQFINYPSFSVYENIASPLRIQGVAQHEIARRVAEMAERLHITPYLQRYPAELSGGQQQRTALARALIKDAGLLLLDEPRVNLDYKLREELRRELTDLFSQGRTTVVYATTEPLEALQLGGQLSVLHEGRLLQHGATLEVFNAPASIQVARTFSDPPLNLMPAVLEEGAQARLADGLALPLNPAQAHATQGQRALLLGLRAHSLRLAPREGDVAIDAMVDLAEISGSETYVHVHRGALSIVAQLPGVHPQKLGAACVLYCRPGDLLLFASDGGLLHAPAGA
ncbi:MAG: ABC transporter ATP-binding protein [Noviherbaspirillum sp.]